MDPYLWLRFAHLVGLILILAGLIGVFRSILTTEDRYGMAP